MTSKPFVRVRIPGVGEWSQEATKPLREDVGEEVVPDSGHDVRYADQPDPPNETPPAAGPAPAATSAQPRPTSEEK